MSYCLLLVNLQNDHFDGGKTPISTASQAAQKAGETLQCFRDHQRPFMHVQTVERKDPSKPFYTGTSGIQFHSRVPHFENEPIGFTFEDGILPIAEISEFMGRSKCDTVVLCYFGPSSEYRDYLKAFTEVGFQTILLSDASAFSDQTDDLLYSETVEKFFSLLASQDRRYHVEIPSTVLYNPDNNVLPKDK